MQRIEEFYAECGIATPEITDVARLIRAPADAVTALLKLGTETGVFVCLADGVYLAGTVLTETQKTISNFCTEHGSITVGEFRDLMNSNRKFAMQVLEYLDSIRFTRRAEDRRTIA
jgi:selenocysteine-specific elongation factor